MTWVGYSCSSMRAVGWSTRIGSSACDSSAVAGAGGSVCIGSAASSSQ